MEECPDCGKKSPAIKLIVGLVAVHTYRCKCGKRWAVASFRQPGVALPAIQDELKRLEKRYPYGPPNLTIVRAVRFLRMKAKPQLPEDLKAKQAREDHWFRQFMKSCGVDDYDYD